MNQTPTAHKTHKKTKSSTASLTRGFAAVAVAAAGLALAIFLLVLPKPESTLAAPGPDSTQQPQSETTLVPETTSPIPTNPYGPEDFGYEGEYLACLAGPAKLGIDVSAHQGDIDWDAVAASGVEFAIVRIGYRGTTSGGLYADENAMQNLTGAREAGLLVGAYFYSQAITPTEAALEAAYCITALEDFPLDLPLVYDWEFAGSGTRTEGMDNQTLMDCIQLFCQAVADAGHQPMVYFNPYLESTMLDLEQLLEYPFWLAMYTDQMTYPHAVEMWQYTENGNVPGISGDVDLNLWFTD